MLARITGSPESPLEYRLGAPFQFPPRPNPREGVGHSVPRNEILLEPQGRPNVWPRYSRAGDSRCLPLLAGGWDVPQGMLATAARHLLHARGKPRASLRTSEHARTRALLKASRACGG